MSRRGPLPGSLAPQDPPEPRGMVPDESRDLEEIKRRLEEATGDEKATTELVRELVLATIREVKNRLREYPEPDDRDD